MSFPLSDEREHHALSDAHFTIDAEGVFRREHDGTPLRDVPDLSGSEWEHLADSLETHVLQMLESLGFRKIASPSGAEGCLYSTYDVPSSGAVDALVMPNISAVLRGADPGLFCVQATDSRGRRRRGAGSRFVCSWGPTRGFQASGVGVSVSTWAWTWARASPLPPWCVDT
eukprot:scaffold1247_cov251-Pinguiococcus_pyrenoidosus.AAC.24